MAPMESPIITSNKANAFFLCIFFCKNGGTCAWNFLGKFKNGEKNPKKQKRVSIFQKVLGGGELHIFWGGG
jgi:hypothetical protein